MNSILILITLLSANFSRAPVPCEAAAKPSKHVKAKPKPIPLAAPALALASAGLEADPPPDSLLEESRLIGTAVRQLRIEENAEAALVTLDTYFARFFLGKLERDARSVQVEALLSLERNEEALQWLEMFADTDFKGVPRSTELRLVLAELLAEAGRYADAAHIFDEALPSLDATPALLERALIGRGVARAHAGNRTGSAEDFARYLAHFPQGRFVDQARGESDTTD